MSVLTALIIGASLFFSESIVSAYYQEGDIVISAPETENGKFYSVVTVNGFKFVPPQAEPYVYRSAQSFDTSSDAVHHGMDYVEKHFPPGVPPVKA
jgi:hypothetical protein